MARERDPARDKAYEMWKESNGKITNREIANILGVDEKKIATWKTRDKWNCSTTKKENVVQQKKKCSTTKKEVVKKEIKEEIIETLVDSELTEKQRLFCTYYMQSFNATQSAIKAGYSRETARAIGCENLRKPNIKKYLNELKELYAQDDYMETKRILERHKQIAFSDVKDFVEFEMSVDDMGVKRWLFKIKDDCEVDGTLIKKIGYSSNGPAIELEGRDKSLDFLTRYYGLDARTELEKAKLEIQARLKVIELEVKNGGITAETETDSKEVEEDLEKWTKEAWD
ncbi:MAG: terminase small subunit [Cetobacterium sp.]